MAATRTPPARRWKAEVKTGAGPGVACRAGAILRSSICGGETGSTVRLRRVGVVVTGEAMQKADERWKVTWSAWLRWLMTEPGPEPRYFKVQ